MTFHGSIAPMRWPARGAVVLPPLPVRLLAPAAAILDGKLIVIAGGMNNTQPVQATTWTRKFP